VERARALPADAWPTAVDRDQDPPQVGMVSSVLGAALADRCARSHLAPNFVCSNNDLKLLVRAHMQGHPPPEESALAHGWRATHILPELTALLDGKRSLRIRDVNAEAPFAYGP
jgi:ribonuclease D